MDIKPQQAVMGAYTAVSAPELFIQKQVATFDGSALPAFSGGFTVVPRQGVRSTGSVPPRFAQQHQQPSRKLQRTGPHVSAVGSNGALAVPTRPPTLRPAHAVSPATPAFVTPKPLRSISVCPTLSQNLTPPKSPVDAQRRHAADVISSFLRQASLPPQIRPNCLLPLGT